MSYQDLTTALAQTSHTIAGLTPHARFQPERSKLSYQLACTLHTTLLPGLRHQLTALSLALLPSDLLKTHFDPSTAYDGFLKLLVQFQPQLSALILTIKNAKKSSPDTSLVDTQLMGRTKFRELCWKTEDLLKIIGALTTAYTAYFSATKTELEKTRADVLQQTSQAWSVIDDTCELLRQSNLESVRTKAKGLVELLEDALEEVRGILERPGVDDLVQALDELSMDESDDHEGSDKLTELERSRVNLTIPLIRLCRVLVTKLVKTNDEQKTIFGQMTVEELEGALECMNRFPDRIDDLVCDLDSSPQSSLPICSSLESLVKDCSQLIEIASPAKLQEIDSKAAHAEEEWYKIWFTQIRKTTDTLLRELD